MRCVGRRAQADSKGSMGSGCGAGGESCLITSGQTRSQSAAGVIELGSQLGLVLTSSVMYALWPGAQDLLPLCLSFPSIKRGHWVAVDGLR